MGQKGKEWKGRGDRQTEIERDTQRDIDRQIDNDRQTQRRRDRQRQTDRQTDRESQTQPASQSCINIINKFVYILYLEYLWTLYRSKMMSLHALLTNIESNNNIYLHTLPTIHTHTYARAHTHTHTHTHLSLIHI